MKQKQAKGKMYFMLIVLGMVNAVMFAFPYLRDIFYNQQLAAMQITNLQSGRLLQIYAIAMMVSMIPGGILADRISVRKALFFSVAAAALIIAVYALTMNYAIACVLWFASGLSTNFVFWCSITKAVGSCGTPEEQGACYGIYYASSGAFAALINAFALRISRLADNDRSSFLLVVWTLAAGTFLCALLVLLLVREPKGMESEKQDDADSFHLSDVGRVLKNPLTWMISLNVFCAYGLYTSGTYFSPYLMNVIGVSREECSFISIIRSNILSLISPLGGFLVDRIFKSAVKWYACAFGITCLVYTGVLLSPTNLGFTAEKIISLIPSMVAMMLYGVCWSCLRELKYETAYIGTMIGIGSIIGYLPDFFYFVLFGSWIDRFGNAAYKMIFGFLLGTAVLGLFNSILILNRNRRRKKADSGNGAERRNPQ